MSEQLNYAVKQRKSPLPFLYLLIAQLPCAFILLLLLGWLLFVFSPLGRAEMYYTTYFRFRSTEQTPDNSTYTAWRLVPNRMGGDELYERDGEIIRFLFTMTVHQVKDAKYSNIETVKNTITVRYNRALPLATLVIVLTIVLVRVWLLICRRLLQYTPNSRQPSLQE